MENNEVSQRNQLFSVDQVSYRGVRKRKWGKWVSEIRESGKKTRIWLGSYETAEMAAAAYDAAALHLRGRGTHLNFREIADSFPRPLSSNAEHVQAAAQEAALMFKPGKQRAGLGASRVKHSFLSLNYTGLESYIYLYKKNVLVFVNKISVPILDFGSGVCIFKTGPASRSSEVLRDYEDLGLGQEPVRVGLTPVEIQAINEIPLESPKMRWMEMEVCDYEEMYGRYFGEYENDELFEMQQFQSIWDFI